MRTKKTITCPEQLISVSCICMSAKMLPYTETLKRPQQTSSRTEGFVFRLNIKVERTEFSCRVQHYTHYMSPPQADSAALSLLNVQLSLLVKPTAIISWPLSPSLRRGEIKSEKIFSGRNTFQKIIRNRQNREQLIRNLHILQQSAQRVEPPVKQRGRPTTISHIWIIICGLFHNMGGIGCCLLRNVYVAPQSSGEILIWCEAELINWFVLVKTAGIIRTNRPFLINRTQGNDKLCHCKRHRIFPASAIFIVVTVCHIYALNMCTNQK